MSDLPASAFAAQVREPSEDEVFTPLNEDALSKLPRRLSDGMRELQHERSRTWADKVGAGNVRMASPSRPQSLLDSETRQAIQEAMDELSDDDFFEAPHDTAPSNTLSPGDARRNRAAIFAWHSPESGPAPQRVLRVINKSPHPSDAGDVPQEPRAPASSSSSSTSSHGIAEQIVPMAHWRAESARIGLPGPVVAGNNSRDPQLQVSVKEVGPFEEGRGEASSAGAAAGRSGFKDRLRRPFGNFSRKLRSKQTDEEGGKLAGSSAQVEPNVQRHVVDAALSTSSSRQEGGQTQRRRQKSPSKGSMTYRGQVENYD
ncbi:MAG: hypothetical protein M1832_005447 [Thelocarpon impressellum]|nr:MAG: hypothetical protein M1832_005447 [Thelocarpon impressellum]